MAVSLVRRRRCNICGQFTEDLDKHKALIHPDPALVNNQIVPYAILPNNQVAVPPQAPAQVVQPAPQQPALLSQFSQAIN